MHTDLTLSMKTNCFGLKATWPKPRRFTASFGCLPATAAVAAVACLALLHVPLAGRNLIMCNMNVLQHIDINEICGGCE